MGSEGPGAWGIMMAAKLVGPGTAAAAEDPTVTVTKQMQQGG